MKYFRSFGVLTIELILLADVVHQHVFLFYSPVDCALIQKLLAFAADSSPVYVGYRGIKVAFVLL